MKTLPRNRSHANVRVFVGCGLVIVDRQARYGDRRRRRRRRRRRKHQRSRRGRRGCPRRRRHGFYAPREDEVRDRLFLHLKNSDQHNDTRVQFDIAQLASEAVIHKSWHKDRSHTTLQKAYPKELLRRFRPSFTPPLSFTRVASCLTQRVHRFGV